MATNSQLSTIESKKQTKQTLRSGTESSTWRSPGRLSAGRGKMEEKVQGLRSMTDRYKIDRVKLRIV